MAYVKKKMNGNLLLLINQTKGSLHHNHASLGKTNCSYLHLMVDEFDMMSIWTRGVLAWYRNFVQSGCCFFSYILFHFTVLVTWNLGLFQ